MRTASASVDCLTRQKDTADDDSALGDDIFTSSITSSIVNYRYENGRRYHAFRDGAYILPNDEKENDRLDITHHMILLLCGGKMHLAPIGSNPQRILDIGTGTGIWCIQMGDEYPSAERLSGIVQILGNDLSPIQPTIVPPNVKFEVDDVESEWTFEAPFDYIHCRYMATSIEDWPALVKRSFQNTKPGGYAEFQDFDLQYYSEDGSMTAESSISRWINLLLDAARQTGRDPCPGPKLEGWFRDAGFTDIHHVRSKLPIGRWPKDKTLKTVGGWNLLQIMEGLDAFSMALFTRVLGWLPQEVEVMLAGVREDLRNPSIHAMFAFHFVYGRKPETAGT
ncbi:MAG: hypothetical protein M1832_006420 [Thelocarpon impressellum]|nr:MAG: hypothetical protein M1832_006420 [Thelocarpon impressellum]